MKWDSLATKHVIPLTKVTKRGASMKERNENGNFFKQRLVFWTVLLLGVLLIRADAWALTLNVVGPNGEAVQAYKWLLEEDATYQVTPGVSDPNSLALKFHQSYMPVEAKGTAANSVNIPADPNKVYYISVLPENGYTNGGARVLAGQGSVTVVVNQLPLPTAQITIFAFEDNAPINNAPDLPEEPGLAGFDVLLYDAGGRYGQSGGQILEDVYGNPIGTTYNPDGSVLVLGNGIIKTDIDGMATIKYLAQGKYTIQIVPPVGSGYVQTTTIEGTKGQDAWVKPNEPPFFAEFGPPGQHVFIGFVKPINDAAVLTGGATIDGQVVNMHLSRPPDYAFYNGAPFGHTTPWIGLNSLAVGEGRGVWAQRANADGTFSIPNVPPGNYQLVVWDDNLDLIIALHGVTIQPGQTSLPLGDVPVFQWFSRLESIVFHDRNQNGFRDCTTPECNDPAQDDVGIQETPVNLRFRDGTIYQSFPTDLTGFVPFDEVFPFFSWLVAEVDFARFKATGVTVVVDGGGPIDPDQGWTYPSRGVLNPQPQDQVNTNTGNNLSRTETGPVLTQGFQGFIGQTSVIEWGKAAYGPGENGGISGVIHYASTRAENDPRYAAPDLWEPGIPRVVVNLYKDTNMDGAIDDLDGDGVATLADADNYPFGNFPAPEDQDRDSDGVFDYGDALQIVSSDSWDDNLPANCPGDPTDTFYNGGKCYDGLRNFNQIRPAVFDGGYAFNSYFPGGMSNNLDAEGNLINETDGLPSGMYIVEAVSPRSPLGNGEYGAAYEIVKEEDKNVDFGDSYVPSPLLLPAVCVGDNHTIPQYLTLFEGAQVPAPFAGTQRPLCDRKQVSITTGVNGAANFFMFTEAPVAGHILGFILDDTTSEFNPASPNFGEKFAPPWVPISIRDWTGREISRTYSDEWGVYNALVPSTYTANVPSPSGYAPNMVTVCLNDPGPIPDQANPGSFITDPYFSRQYSQFCYTFQYMPGTTTYLDTPVVPVAAFAGPNQYPLDCEYAEGTPKIYSVSGPMGGPYVPAAGAGHQISIVSEGLVAVPNPLYDGKGGLNPQTVQRDYGFGANPGTVTINGVPLTVTAWSAGSITATVPAGITTGNLVVTRSAVDNGKPTEIGVTVTVGPMLAGTTVRTVAPGGSIQAAIDLARQGDLILVPPGNYEEMVIMWKPVKLQGWGPGSVNIKAINAPAEKLLAWRQKVETLVTTGAVDLLPSQEALFGGLEPDALFTEEGAGIIVLARNVNQSQGGFGPIRGKARIDGLTVSGSSTGGGIIVNGYAHYLDITNNRVVNNQGFYGGGVRIGHPTLTLETNQGLEYQNSFNDNIRISNNHLTQNSSLGGAGGGVSLYTGAYAYQVTRNFICGNFTLGEGAGVGHRGLSDNGRIANNRIMFNQSFNQGTTVSGGGILVSGGAPINGPGSLTPGSGDVLISSNLIQGNLAGAGDGGGIRTSRVNGVDVDANANQPNNWYRVNVFNNLIVNNVAALAGGAISMQDTARINILENTITNNDSTGTAGEAFTPGSPNQSNPQPAGIVSRAHSADLAAAFGNTARVAPYKVFSNPFLVNNIIRHNRSFYFVVDNTQDPPFYGLMPDVQAGSAPVYWDLWVLGTPVQMFMNPLYSILTDTTGYGATNFSADPLFVDEYLNGARNQVLDPEITTAIQAAPAFDEGGNFIDVRFGPLTATGNYHLGVGSPAVDRANAALNSLYPALQFDYDGQVRPNGVAPDIGADELY